MGWLFKAGYSRKDMIEERVRSWDTTIPDGTLVKSVCLAHCYRGGAFSGVLWSVWERTFEKDGQLVRPTERWIACDLLRYERGEWAYKDMDEACGPYFYSCPLKYLDMVPLDQYGGNEGWRECVRSYHARAKDKRQRRAVEKQTPSITLAT